MSMFRELTSKRELLGRIGQPSDQYVVVPPWSLSSAEMVEWLQLMFERLQDVSVAVCVASRRRHRSWNFLVREANQLVGRWTQKFDIGPVPDAHRDLVVRVLSTIGVYCYVEESYRDLLRRQLFFCTLSEAVLDGRLPVGWRNDETCGVPIVY